MRNALEIVVAGSSSLAVAPGPDDDSSFGDPFGEMIRIVSFAGDGDLGVDALDQVVGKGNVVVLAGRADRRTGKPRASVAAWILVLKPGLSGISCEAGG